MTNTPEGQKAEAAHQEAVGKLYEKTVDPSQWRYDVADGVNAEDIVSEAAAGQASGMPAVRTAVPPVMSIAAEELVADKQTAAAERTAATLRTVAIEAVARQLYEELRGSVPTYQRTWNEVRNAIKARIEAMS